MNYCENCHDDINIRQYCHTCYSQLEAENKRLREALEEARTRSNSYAKRLVLEGHDDVIWYATSAALGKE
jgi:hypothetical protein